MPGIDGYEVCRRLKADKRTRSIPVLFLSALTETEDKVKGFACGGLVYRQLCNVG
jgi:DNA-binding response OmpR family regulator